MYQKLNILVAKHFTVIFVKSAWNVMEINRAKFSHFIFQLYNFYKHDIFFGVEKEKYSMIMKRLLFYWGSALYRNRRNIIYKNLLIFF